MINFISNIKVFKNNSQGSDFYYGESNDAVEILKKLKYVGPALLRKSNPNMPINKTEFELIYPNGDVVTGLRSRFLISNNMDSIESEDDFERFSVWLNSRFEDIKTANHGVSIDDKELILGARGKA